MIFASILNSLKIDLVLHASVLWTAGSNHALSGFAGGTKCDKVKGACAAKYWQLNNSIHLSLRDVSNDRSHEQDCTGLYS